MEREPSAATELLDAPFTVGLAIAARAGILRHLHLPVLSADARGADTFEVDLKTVEKSGSCERKRSHFGQAQFGNNGTIKKIYEPYGASEEPAIAAREGTLKPLHLPVQSPDERCEKSR